MTSQCVPALIMKNIEPRSCYGNSFGKPLSYHAAIPRFGRQQHFARAFSHLGWAASSAAYLQSTKDVDKNQLRWACMHTSSHRLKLWQCHRSRKHCVTVVLRCSKFKAFFRGEKKYLLDKNQRWVYICILVVVKHPTKNCGASKNPFWLWRAVANDRVCVPGNTQQNLCKLHPAWSEGCPDPNKPARRSAWSLGFRGEEGIDHAKQSHGLHNFVIDWCQLPMEPNPTNSNYCTTWNSNYCTTVFLIIF